MVTRRARDTEALLASIRVCKAEAAAALRKAVRFFREEVAVEGGYVMAKALGDPSVLVAQLKPYGRLLNPEKAVLCLPNHILEPR